MPSLSINRTIPLLIVSPILASIAVTGYLGHYNGRKAVDDLAQRINLQTTRAIEAYLQEFLSAPHEILAFNEAYIQSTNLDVNDFETLRTLFSRLVPEKARGLSYGNERGNYIGVLLDETNDKDVIFWLRDETTVPNVHLYKMQPGQEDVFKEANLYDPRQRPWYQKAREEGTATWSNVYAFAGSGVLGMSAASPIYRDEQVLEGVFITDVVLSDVNNFLENLYISPQGEAFIIERNGAVVGNSLGESPFIVVDGQQERMDIRESPHPLLREVARAIFEQMEAETLSFEEDEYFTAIADRTRQYIGVMPVTDGRGIDWLIIVAIPETDFAHVINASVRSTLIVGGAIAVLATVMGLLAAKWIVTPIQSLNWAAKAIKEDRFEPATLTRVTQRQDEVGELARVFESMGTVISASQASLKQQMSELADRAARAQRQKSDRRRYNPASIRELLERSRQTRHRHQGETEISSIEPDALAAFFKNISEFAAFSSEEIEAAIAVGESRTLSPGREILRAGASNPSLSLILAGSVVEEREGNGEDAPPLLTSGAACGRWSFWLGIPATVTLKTTVPTQLFTLDRQGCQKFLAEHPEAIDKIILGLAREGDRLLLLKASIAPEVTDENPPNSDDSLPHWLRERLIAVFDLSREKI